MRLFVSMTCSLLIVFSACVPATPNSGGNDGGNTLSDAGVPPQSDAGPSDDCPVQTFMDLSGYAGAAGAGYPDPALAVHCTDEFIVVESNGIIHYPYVAMTPNPLSEQDYTWEVVRYPAVADEPTDLPLLGAAGIAVNGLPWYGPNEGEFPDPYGDPVYNGIVDDCLGHTAQRGDYHYHALLVSCLTQALDLAKPDPIIGYAFDGFPIYGPRGCLDDACDEMVEFKSSWVQTGDPRTYAWDNHEYRAVDSPEYLDECNGRVGPDGTYRYHATTGFPYIASCYRGTPGGSYQDRGNGGGGNPGGGPQACEEDADCADACPNAALGCTCHDGPRGQVCVPVCTTDEDCPRGPMGQMRCDQQQGICTP
jgi:hypothetical protein